MYKAILIQGRNIQDSNIRASNGNIQGSNIRDNADTKKIRTGTAFCRVCKNAGKTEEEYRSHYTKDGKGTVFCPTILNTTCSYCKIQGHFKKECPTLKEKEEMKSLKIMIPNNHIKEDETPPAPKWSTYKEAVISEEMYTQTQMQMETPQPQMYMETPSILGKRRRNIEHDWNDEEYWSDSNQEFN